MLNATLTKIIRPIIRRVIPPYFSPIDLFSTGQQGAWYDPSDIATLFQDKDGTTPVTALDQQVGLILDKSGNGNHAFTPSASITSRPTLKADAKNRLYLMFDGVDDYMQTNNINFSTTDKITFFAGLTKLSDNAGGVFVELSSDSGANNGTFCFNAPAGAAANYFWRSKGTLSASSTTASIYPAPLSSVVTGIGDIANDISELRHNGLQILNLTANQGTGNYGNYPLYIGRRGGTVLPFNGRMYGLIVRGSKATTEEITDAENWLAQKTGVLL